MLRGRDDELAELRRLVDALRDGRSGVLVLLGEAGVGKTALLDDVVAGTAGLRVVRVAGIESEMELPFAALHQLIGPLLDRLDRLPDPQREAIATLFGMSTGPVPTPFLVGLAVLTLLAEAAAVRPLLCVVDDAQWLDSASAQVLAFAGRRLVAESVLMLFAARESVPVLAALPELTVRGLSDDVARELLAGVVRWPLDKRVRDAILAEAHGNPLALLELPLMPGEAAGGYRLPLAGRIETGFLRRFDDLSDDARLLLLVAAADPVGDPALLWRAAGRLGLGHGLADQAEAAGLLRIGMRVVFRHPLVRSAIYRAATPADRRRAHLALAEATNRDTDPDRHAWHRASAAAGPDESVAAELEAAAERARSFGGSAAAAAFLERAADLTPDPSRRADRELAAAWAKSQAGANDSAQMLLARADSGPSDPRRKARSATLRGQLTSIGEDKREGPALQLETARQYAELDARLSRDAYLDAFSGGFYVGRLAGSVGLAEVAEASRDAPPAPAPVTAADLLLDGLAVLFNDGYGAGVPAVRAALTAYLEDEPPLGIALRFYYLAIEAGHLIWDDELLDRLTARFLKLARDAGALTLMPGAVHLRVGSLLHGGEIAKAAALAEELDAIGQATNYGVSGFGMRYYASALVAAWQGDERAATPVIEQVGAAMQSRAEGVGYGRLQHANAVLNSGLGRFPEALAAARLATSTTRANGRIGEVAHRGLVELIEAAVRCDRRDLAVEALGRLESTAGQCGTAWGLGATTYARAVLSDDAELFRESLALLERSRGTVAVGRVHNAYGKWLGINNRQPEALQEFRAAHEIFVRCGAAGFAERVRRELAAGGERISEPENAGPVELTEQELQVARRARDGQSNPEIAAELFLSARTVEWHLRKVFGKLGISSRRDLPAVLGSFASLRETSVDQRR